MQVFKVSLRGELRVIPIPKDGICLGALVHHCALKFHSHPATFMLRINEVPLDNESLFASTYQEANGNVIRLSMEEIHQIPPQFGAPHNQFNQQQGLNLNGPSPPALETKNDLQFSRPEFNQFSPNPPDRPHLQLNQFQSNQHLNQPQSPGQPQLNQFSQNQRRTEQLHSPAQPQLKEFPSPVPILANEINHHAVFPTTAPNSVLPTNANEQIENNVNRITSLPERTVFPIDLIQEEADEDSGDYLGSSPEVGELDALKKAIANAREERRAAEARVRKEAEAEECRRAAAEAEREAKEEAIRRERLDNDRRAKRVAKAELEVERQRVEKQHSVECWERLLQSHPSPQSSLVQAIHDCLPVCFSDRAYSGGMLEADPSLKVQSILPEALRGLFGAQQQDGGLPDNSREILSLDPDTSVSVGGLTREAICSFFRNLSSDVPLAPYPLSSVEIEPENFFLSSSLTAMFAKMSAVGCRMVGFDLFSRALIVALWELTVLDPTVLRNQINGSNDDEDEEEARPPLVFGGARFAELSTSGRARMLTAMSLSSMNTEEVLVAIENLEHENDDANLTGLSDPCLYCAGSEAMEVLKLLPPDKRDIFCASRCQPILNRGKLSEFLSFSGLSYLEKPLCHTLGLNYIEELRFLFTLEDYSMGAGLTEDDVLQLQRAYTVLCGWSWRVVASKPIPHRLKTYQVKSMQAPAYALRVCSLLIGAVNAAGRQHEKEEGVLEVPGMGFGLLWAGWGSSRSNA